MIAGAAICPSAPLLARELTGLDPVIPELREACAAASARAGPVAARSDSRGRTWAAHRDLARGRRPGPRRVRPGAGFSRPPAGPPDCRFPLGLGARLLDEDGYQGPRVLQVGGDSMSSRETACGSAPASAASPNRVGLLVMADGSARRSLRAPGYLDPRAAAFDAAIEQAVRGGDLGPLRAVDAALARDVLAAGRPAWQVLAGALPGRAPAVEVLYADDPFGVFYLVAWLAGPRGGVGRVRARLDAVQRTGGGHHGPFGKECLVSRSGSVYGGVRSWAGAVP